MVPVWSFGQEPESALDYPEGFEQMSSEEKTEALHDLADGYRGEPYVRIEVLNEMLATARSSGLSEVEAEALLELADTYTQIGFYQKGLELASKGLEQARKAKVHRNIVYGHFRMSTIYLYFEEFETAQTFADSSLYYAQLASDTILEGWAYNMLGEVTRLREQPQEALSHYEGALQIFTEQGFGRGENIVIHNMGLAYASLKEPEMAWKYFERVPKPKDLGLVGALEKGMAVGEILLATEGVDAALNHLDTLADLAIRESMTRWHLECLLQMMELYTLKGDAEKVYRAYQQADSLEKVIEEGMTSAQVELLQQQSENQKAWAEFEILEKANENQRLWIISSITILGLLVGLGILLFLKNRKISQVAARLEANNHQLDELLKEKDMWIHLMAHDLKSPLNAMGGLLDMARDPATPAPLRNQLLSKIDQTIRNSTEMVSQLLQLAQIESDQMDIHMTSTEVAPMLHGLMEEFQAQADKKKIALTLGSVPPVTVHSDAQITERILANFLSNALKFSTSGDQVELWTEEKAGQIEVHVRDTGPGLSPADQEQLFQKFSKLSPQPTDGESSTGLGLSIVKALSEKIHAEIQVESELGKRSTFSLIFPAV